MEIDTLRSAFTATFGMKGRPFGTPRGRWIGVSDDARGVQWNAALDQEQGIALLGVNLEGIMYDGWPIARLIEREMARPTLPAVGGDLGDVIVSLMRDAWQPSVRPVIAEHQIGLRAPLAELTTAKWREMLAEAYQCLDPKRGHRGRTRQVVTTPSARAEQWVSPHLHLGRVLWQTTDAASSR